MDGPSGPSAEQSHRAALSRSASAQPTRPAVPRPEPRARHVADRTDRRAGACPERIVLARVGGSPKMPVARDFAPITRVAAKCLETFRRTDHHLGHATIAVTLPKTRMTTTPGRLIGYARVSTDEQGTDPQRDELHAAGCDTILEEHASGADR